MPIRTIKPQFFRSRKLATLSHRARLTLIGLWCEADGHGRGVADEFVLKGAIWPLDHGVTPDDVIDDLDALVDAEQIVLYELGDDRYFSVLDWEKHQAANYRRGESSLPSPDQGSICTPMRARCTPERANSQITDVPPGQDTFARIGVQAARSGVLEGKGREGKTLASEDFDAWWESYPRKEGKGNASKAYAKALTSATAQELADGLERARADWKRRKVERQYIPHPATWLNRHGWQDELAGADDMSDKPWVMIDGVKRSRSTLV